MTWTPPPQPSLPSPAGSANGDNRPHRHLTLAPLACDDPCADAEDTVPLEQLEQLQYLGQLGPMDIPHCPPGHRHHVLAALPNATVFDVLLCIHALWSPELVAMPQTLGDLVQRPYLLGFAYLRYWACQPEYRPYLAVQLHHTLCCLLRGLNRDPERLRTEAELNQLRLRDVPPSA